MINLCWAFPSFRNQGAVFTNGVSSGSSNMLWKSVCRDSVTGRSSSNPERYNYFFCYSFYFLTVTCSRFFLNELPLHFPLSSLTPLPIRTNKTNRLLKTPSVQVLCVPSRSVAGVPAALAQNRPQHSPTGGRGGALFTTPGLRLLTASPSKQLQLCGTPCVTDTSAGGCGKQPLCRTAAWQQQNLISPCSGGGGQIRSQLKGRSRSQSSFASASPFILRDALRHQEDVALPLAAGSAERQENGGCAGPGARGKRSRTCACKGRPRVWRNKDGAGEDSWKSLEKSLELILFPSLTALCRSGPSL